MNEQMLGTAVPNLIVKCYHRHQKLQQMVEIEHRGVQW